MSTLNSSLSRAKYVVWLWLFGISSFHINGIFVLLRFATALPFASFLCVCDVHGDVNTEIAMQ